VVVVVLVFTVVFAVVFAVGFGIRLSCGMRPHFFSFCAIATAGEAVAVTVVLTGKCAEQ